MTTNAAPRRYTVNVEGEISEHASKAAATKAFHAAALAGRTVFVFTPAGHACDSYLAEQGPVEVIDGELRAVDVEVELTDDEIAEAREELEADNAAGAAMLAETRVERLTIPARQLRRADRIVNLAAGRTVTAFDLTIGDDTVDVFPAADDLDAGVERKLTVAAGELLVVDREVELNGTPVRPAVTPAPIPADEIRVGDQVRVRPQIGLGSHAHITMTVTDRVELGDGAVGLIGRKHRADFPGDFAGIAYRVLRAGEAGELLARTAR